MASKQRKKVEYLRRKHRNEDDINVDRGKLLKVLTEIESSPYFRKNRKLKGGGEREAVRQ